MISDPTVDNLRLAYERTTLAWTSTSLALIGFGFTIDKFFEASPKRVATAFGLGPHSIGITMIGFGLLALLLSTYEMRQFRKAYPQAPRSMAGFVAGLIGVLGIMTLIAAVAS